MCNGSAQRYSINVRTTVSQQSHLLPIHFLFVRVILTLKMKLCICSTLDFIGVCHVLVGYLLTDRWTYIPRDLLSGENFYQQIGGLTIGGRLVTGLLRYYYASVFTLPAKRSFNTDNKIQLTWFAKLFVRRYTQIITQRGTYGRSDWSKTMFFRA